MKKTSIISRLLAALLVPLAVVPAGALAQNYPSKTITMIVPVAAGGVTDQMGRLFANEMTKSIGEKVIVENRPGVNGVAGANVVAKAAADGYTLCFCYSGPVALAKVSTPDLPYDIDKDFTPISRVYDLIPVITVPANSRFNTLADMINYAKANPGKLSYGHTGVGGALHLGFELLKSVGNFDILAISYNGENPIVPDLVTGRLDMALFSPLFAKAQADAGKAKMLAHSGADRLQLIPNVPTVASQGYSGYQSGTWSGIFAPANIQPTVVQKLYDSIQIAARDKATQDRILTAGLSPVIGNSPAQFKEFVDREKKNWADLIKKLGGIPK